MSKVPYANAVGSLMYLMVCTRPDITYVVSVVSRYLANPGKNHWEAVKWILKYFRGRSITGYAFLVYGCVVSWKATLQHVMALSTTEAGYMPFTEAVKEAIWLRGLLEELGVELNTVAINYDNQDAIHLSRNHVFHEKTKHINVRYHFIREVLEAKTVKWRSLKRFNGRDEKKLKIIPQVVSAAKLPILNLNEFDLWKMRIEQYFLMTDYSLWEVILNGDSPAPTRVIEGVVQPVGSTTTEHRSLPTEWRTHTLIWRNKIDLEKQSLDDLFNNLKIYEAEVKSSSSASNSTQNIAFVSSQTTDSTNDPVSVVASVSAATMTRVFRQKKNQPTMPLWNLPLQVLLVLTMRNIYAPKPDLVFHNAPNVNETVHIAFNVELSLTKPDNDLSHTHRPSTPIIEDWVSNSKDNSEAEIPQNAPSFVQPIEQVKTPRPSVKTFKNFIPTTNTKTAIPKPKSNANHRNRKACFVCKCLDHLIKDCVGPLTLADL
nr:retrovirus-related Pol polyprotein from transposon TNT 1-94 [Tanacetum cinerariifolium]